MRVKKNIIVFVLTGMLLTACKENYEPPVIKTNVNLLVVDGFLNNSTDTTSIRLSRTRKLSDGTSNAAELHAQITVEDASGTPLYYFQEMNNGAYIVPGMNLDIGRIYRLHINTADGKQYTSDEIAIRQTPSIDSISWERQEDGVTIFVNTHDPLNNTRYYRWDYTETWEYYSKYVSGFKYENHEVIPRRTDEDIFTCWTTKNSTDLFLGSSAKLSEDIIHKSPLRFIPVNAVEISGKYSILVRQYAITKEGYEYFQNLKKITEQLGSIFDAQPSQLTGNIHSSDDPTEPVLGFVTASSVDTKRIFIKNGEVLPWQYRLQCDDKFIVPLDSLEHYFGAGVYVPTTEYAPRGAIEGYYAGSAGCVDCRTHGGKNIKPDFWP